MKFNFRTFLPIMLISALLILLAGCFSVPADESPGYTPGAISGTIARPEVCCGEPSESSLVGDAISPNVCDVLTLCDPQNTADWYAWANVEVTLTTWIDCEEIKLASTMTDENGDYLFSNVSPGKNYIITAICPEEKDFKVKDVAEEVLEGKTYDAGVSDAESTVLALCLEGLGEVCLDSDALDLNDFRSHLQYDKVTCEVCDKLAECLYAIPEWVCEITELCPGYTDFGDDDDDDVCPDPTANTNGPYADEVCPGAANALIDLTGSGSGTGMLYYAWDLDNDGQFDDSTAQDPQNIPFTVGVHNVSLQVTDNCGSATNATTVTITESTGVTANAGGPYSDEVCPGFDSTINFVGSGSGTGTLVYDWDFGDGTGALDAGATPSHTYLNPFTGSPYTVTLTVKDACGSKTDTATVTITECINNAPVIDNLPPTSVQKVNKWQTYTYNVNATDVDGDTITYSLTTNPNGMIINSSTGVITWTCANCDGLVCADKSEGKSEGDRCHKLCDIPVTVKVTSGGCCGPLFDEESFTVEVWQP